MKKLVKKFMLLFSFISVLSLYFNKVYADVITTDPIAELVADLFFLVSIGVVIMLIVILTYILMMKLTKNEINFDKIFTIPFIGNLVLSVFLFLAKGILLDLVILSLIPLFIKKIFNNYDDIAEITLVLSIIMDLATVIMIFVI